jgi:heptosyltransferase-1
VLGPLESINILIILPVNLGDIIMATPVCEGLKKKYKNAYISFLVEEGFEESIYNNPFCDKILKIPRKEIKNVFNNISWKKGYELMQNFLKDIEKDKITNIINLSQTKYTAILSTLIGAANITGQQYLKEGNYSISDEWSQYLYAIPFARECNNMHATDVYRRIAKVKSHLGGYTFALTDNEKKWAKDFLINNNIDLNKKIVVFQPGAAFLSKCWPIEYFIKLGKLLINDDWQICILGAPSEKEIAEKISLSFSKNCISAAGKTTFRQSAALVSFSNACVTGDTAIMHAASALKIPTYALFGSTNPVETGPYGNGNFILSGNCPQLPCFKTTCESMQCMKTILPEYVYCCIKNTKDIYNLPCNIYKTFCDENNDYYLKSITKNCHKYFIENNVCLVRNIFNEKWNCNPNSRVDFAKEIESLGRWLEIVSDLCNFLIRFEQKGNIDDIKKFEQKKRSLIEFNGVAAFCTALLNIRLNSIPILSPKEAVKKSLEACWEIHKKVSKAITCI